ncbi:MAG: PSD1 and planctomycete cytochrome C domain-containing protein [Verrucomicrobiota bacterium]
MIAARRILNGLLATLIATVTAGAAAAKPDAEELFVHRVLPVFKEKCFACHGDDPKKIKGDFVMLTREALLKGGESEKPSIVPGKPEESPLYIAVTRKDEDLVMPPKENDKLTSEQVEYIKQWIAGGAPWPNETRLKEIAKVADKWSAEDGIAVATSGGLSPDWTNRKYKPENLWAYQPLKKPAVPGGKSEIRIPNSEGSPNAEFRSNGATNPIDAFINAKLMELKLPPAPLADRRTLIRRVTYDLIGLPPTPEEVEAFLKDPLPDDKAFAKVVERLLGSPHYGERWGQHWLDVVRYADSSGFANDYVRGNTWRYRDYVIRAFNQDKPYDQFVREQIAGDEIDPNNPEMLVAAGFLRMGPWELTGMEVAKVARQRFLDDATDMVGQVFMGHMLQCARCHDHKFDPIPTRDYYSMQAVFATTQLAERDAPFLPGENTLGFEERKYLEKRRQEHLATLKELDAKSLKAAEGWFKEKGIDPAAWNEVVAEAKQKDGGTGKREFVGAFNGARNRMMARKIPEDQFPPKLYGFSPEDYGRERVARKGLERLRWEFERYQPIAFTVYDGRTPDVKSVNAPARMPATRMTVGELEQTAVLAGGDPFSPTKPVEPGVLSVVDKFTASYVEDFPKLQIPDAIEGRRKALAEWITHPKHPLTARVMANRIWQWHFGQAIAGNPNNFGATGKKPTHPELLDWLAATFIEQGWSVKAMHRLILSSEAYRRAATHPNPKVLAEKDPNNISFAVFKPRRLTAEELRDSMLRVSGELNPALGGIPARPEINIEAALQPRQVMGTFAEAWQPSPKPEQRHRRSIYALKIRGQLDPFMEVFNSPTPDLSCEAREASTVTPQVFSLFNGQGSYDRALALAARLKKETSSRHAALERAFNLAYGRKPSAQEVKACLAHWDAMTARHKTLKFEQPQLPKEVVREAVEENTGEKFVFSERLAAYDDFIPDLKPADADAETRGLAEVCLVLFNSNEFAYVY